MTAAPRSMQLEKKLQRRLIALRGHVMPWHEAGAESRQRTILTFDPGFWYMGRLRISCFAGVGRQDACTGPEPPATCL